MSARKKQVWLRPDQVELNILALKFTLERLAENRNTNSAAGIMAQNFCSVRVCELLVLLGAK